MSALVNFKRYEAEPETWPAAPTGLSAGAAAIDPSVIWTRLESWIAVRYAARSVVWASYVEANDYLTERRTYKWAPDLTPVTLSKAEIWANEWVEFTPDPGPFGGYTLSGRGLYRFTGTAGDGSTPPEIILEAYRRLAEYFASECHIPAGAKRNSIRAGNISLNTARDPDWLAKALPMSGAADLLRPYRKAQNV